MNRLVGEREDLGCLGVGAVDEYDRGEVVDQGKAAKLVAS
jgi:hypothetical protein